MRVNRSGVRWSVDALAALYPGTRTSVKRAELVARQADAMTREVARYLAEGMTVGTAIHRMSMAEQPSDAEQVRDIAAEEAEALAAQRKREAELIRKQRERE